MKYRYQTLDVFTSERFGGNPLAVVPDAVGLDGEQMQRIAREFNLSETTFVLSPEDPANTAKVRIFTPAAELPFAGHPTVGTAVALAEALNSSADGYNREIRLEEQIGVLPVAVSRNAGGVPFGQFATAVLPAPAGEFPSDALIAAALSLEEADIAGAEHKAGVFNAGNSFLFAPVCDMAALAACEIDTACWKRISAGKGWIGVFAYCAGGEAADAAYRGRMFGPDFGVPEDPATGSAAATFPGQVAGNERLAEGTHEWLVEQGYEMGRPSQIFIEADVKDGAVAAVRVGGGAVHVSEGEIEV